MAETVTAVPAVKAAAPPCPVRDAAPVVVNHTGSLFDRALIVAALLVLSLGYASYRQEHEDRVKMQATVAAQQTVIDQQQAAAKLAEQRIAARDAALTKTLDTLDKVQAHAPASAAETAAEISRYLQLPQAPAVVPVAGQLPTAQLPAAGSVIFTPPQAEDLRRAAVGCAEDAAKLSGCEQDAKDNAAKMAALEAQNKALTAQRDAAIRAVKGGSFWTRLKRNTEREGVGFVAGFVAGRVILK